MHGFYIPLHLSKRVELSIWHQYLLVEFILRLGGFPDCSRRKTKLSQQDLDNNFGFIAEVFLKLGADPQFLVTVKHEDPANEEDGQAIFQFGRDGIPMKFSLSNDAHWDGAHWLTLHERWRKECTKWTLKD